MIIPASVRFFAKVSPEPNTGCWLWAGGCQYDKYGRVWHGRFYSGERRGALAHRFSWEHRNGRVPAGKQILHKCDVPCCVNPEHLYPGLPADNMRDKVSRGRHRHRVSCGEEHAMHKLTNRDAADIYRSTAPRSQLAVAFGVNITTVRKVQNGQSWRHLHLAKG